MKLEGVLRGRQVRMDGHLLDPDPSLAVFNHSPTGFSWGYAGSGPAQLALAVLLKAGVGEERAVRLHQLLKRDLIQNLPQTDFQVEFDLDGWLHRHPAFE